MTTQVLETPDVDLVYDVHGPLPAAAGRAALATADLLGQQPTVFPSHHGGFVGGGSGYAGKPEAFARKLRAVLDDRR